MPIWLPGLVVGATLLMLIGMALGYAANTSASVWRRRFETERAHYTDYRKRSAAQRSAARAAANTRPAPMPVSTQSPPPAEPERPSVPAPSAEPASLTCRELLRIEGIDEKIADRLEALGVATIHDLATLTPEDELALELRLGLNAGTITRDKWCVQAALLDKHSDR
ncbi:MAG: hypothetical protein C0476_00510 [Sphingomonas sp.]|nr:hypothetical protein [Sphingomonas sp.]